MNHFRRKLATGGICALLLCAGFAAHAQDNAVGPAQLKDFQLRGQPVVQQPQPPPVQVAPPPPVAAQPAPAGVRPAQPAAQRPEAQASQGPATGAAPQSAAPADGAPAPQAPVAQGPAPAAEPPAQPQGAFPWIYAIPAALLLALLGVAFVRSRRRRGELAFAAAELPPAPAAEPSPFARPRAAPRPEPVPRPWLELRLKAERATASLTETVVMFELEIANTGKAAARDLRIDVKMFNAGQEQDKEIGAFFRTAGRESTKCSLPGIAAGTTGVIHGQVTMKRDDMRAVRLDDKLLFIPMVGVNALYDWGENETGQTSRSWVVGRELETPSEKMGAFRVDLGPRVWRTVGQRQHKLARQV